MAAHGKLDQFHTGQDDWESYEERLQQYFVANDVKDAEKQRAILLSTCGQSTYKVIRNLVAPTKPGECEYRTILEHLRRYYSPKPSIIVQRCKFNTRYRQQGESIAKFVAELRHIAQFCGYDAALEEMLRDRLVCGVNDPRIQKRLLAEPELTLKKAFELAQAIEMAEQDTRDLVAAQGQNTVNQVRKSGGTRHMNCYRCKRQHDPATCKFKEAKCHGCGKIGHILKACMNKKQPSQPATHSRAQHVVQMDVGHTTPPPPPPVDDSEVTQTYTLFPLQTQHHPPINIVPNINGQGVSMELDTGAAISVINELTYKTVLAQLPLQKSNVKLHTYSGEQLCVLGELQVTVQYNEQTASLPLIVLQGSGPNLFGRNWLEQIKLNWPQLCTVKSASALQEVLDQHEAVFRDELGKLEGTQVSIEVDSDAQPRFFKPRPLPFMLKSKVEDELDRLQANGVISPVKFSKWAAPIVPVVKSDGKIRICGDYKMTINQSSRVDKYPLPKADDLFVSLSGGTKFSKLDLAHAYLQLCLDDKSKSLVTINTHRGLFEYNRLPFGVSTAPAIFQRTIDSLLQGIPNVCAYLDDIIITGKTEEEHLQNLSAVLSKLQEAGLRLKRSKCYFMAESVEYLGHIIDAKGLHPTKAKVAAVQNSPVPRDITQLKSFLGLINYYRKFLPDLSSLLAPLNNLLQKGVKWTWTEAQQTTFDEAKQLLQSSVVLAHYDPSKELVLACDASPYGVGAVLSQYQDDKTEKPIAFASRSLSKAEKNYSHLEKEGLAVIFGVKHFHQYLYGRHFTILTDHQPLRRLFSETKAVPPMASGRIQRWALTLSSYEYELRYRKGADQGNCDALSRLPLPDSPESVPIPGDVMLLTEQLASSPVTAHEIKTMTFRDPVLSKVLQFVLHGWPITAVNEELRPYYRRREELSHFEGCILWGHRVVIPPQAQETILKVLHEGHPGSTRMKQLARGYVWWPNLNTQLENIVSSCEKCQLTRPLPAKAPLHTWQWPERPWSRIHVDYAGPFLNKMFLVIIDAHSKWLEVLPVNNATTAATIEQLLNVFTTHGLPNTIVSDNGSVFTSDEFSNFINQNGIEHIRTSPYHPASNGLAERSVQTFKMGLKRITEGSLQARLNKFLFQYRLTPQTTTGLSPAELMFGRRLRSHLDLLMPSIATRVNAKQQQQRVNHDANCKLREFNIGDTVYIRNFRGTTSWIPGIVNQCRGPVSYSIKLNDGTIVRRHVDHVKTRQPTDDTTDLEDDFYSISDSAGTIPVSIDESPNTVELRRSSRQRRPPQRYCDHNPT